MKKPTAKTLNAIDMSPILDNIPSTDTNRIYIAQEAGREHYRLFLFAYLVKSGKFTKVTFCGLAVVLMPPNRCYTLARIINNKF